MGLERGPLLVLGFQRYQDLSRRWNVIAWIHRSWGSAAAVKPQKVNPPQLVLLNCRLCLVQAPRAADVINIQLWDPLSLRPEDPARRRSHRGVYMSGIQGQAAMNGVSRKVSYNGHSVDNVQLHDPAPIKYSPPHTAFSCNIVSHTPAKYLYV